MLLGLGKSSFVPIKANTNLQMNVSELRYAIEILEISQVAGICNDFVSLNTFLCLLILLIFNENKYHLFAEFNML